MNAILGRVAFDERPIAAEAVRAALSAIRPAGTRRTGESHARAGVLAHHQLGLARGRPVDDAPLTDGRLTVAADAILDDRAALAETLGMRAAACSDAALILAAWQHWGAEAPTHLLGDFAVAVHDAEARSLTLVRDHIGARPLYWMRARGEVIVTSYLRALAAMPDLSIGIEEARVARFLRDPSDVTTDCFVAGARAVAPGTLIHITRDGTAEHRWWDPASLTPTRLTNRADHLAAFRAIFERAVADRLCTDAPIGAHISGGIDSTAVTVEAARRLAQEGRTLNAGYAWAPAVSDACPDQGEGDERRVIRAVCDAEGVPLRDGRADGATFRALLAREMELEGTADLMDELPVLARAEADGTRVLLSGWGGDEAFSAHGRGHVAHLLRSGRLGPALALARRAARGLRRPHRMAGFLWRAGLVPMLPGPIYRQFQPFDDIYKGGCHIHPDLARRHGPDPGEQSLRLLPHPTAYMRQLILNGHIGERMATWAAWGAAHGVTYRFPLTDRRLMEFVLTSPPDALFEGGRGRALPRDALGHLLPRGLKKHDPANEALRHANRHACWALLQAELTQGRLDADCPWLDMPGLRESIRRGPAGERKADIIRFAKITAAMRIWHVWERAEAREAQPAPHVAS